MFVLPSQERLLLSCSASVRDRPGLDTAAACKETRQKHFRKPDKWIVMQHYTVGL